MTTTSASAYEQLITQLREIALLGSTASVLHWDEQTYMPDGAAEYRAQQVSLLARLCHQQFTSARFGDLLAAAEQENAHLPADSDAGANLRETRREYDRATLLPSELVEQLSHVTIMGQQAWAQARSENRFSDFQPWLEKILALKRTEAELVGAPGAELYDGLLDEYEPGMTAARLREIFADLRQSLVEIVAAVGASSKTPPTHILSRPLPVSAQQSLCHLVAQAVGFDFSQGRLDVSAHPFCSFIAPGDTRMTTRYQETDATESFFSVLHETGHGLYDQGLAAQHFGTPVGSYLSLGIHESQSRLWENFVGRSQPFWQWMLPRFQQEFTGLLDDIALPDWMFAINAIQPNLIRTSSDEVTYNLHIILRFELELALLSGDLAVADLPAAWNEKMQSFLGIAPPDDAHGCLQDIHWSGGAFGYFPTYTLGNIISAQLYQAASQQMPGMEEGFARGEFQPLLGWLRENIHQHGKRYTTAELVQRVCGGPVDSAALITHLRSKAYSYYG